MSAAAEGDAQKPCEAKVVVIGSTMVGKTSLVNCAVTGIFDETIPATVGACYQSKVVSLPGATINLQIWDTAGQEKYHSLSNMYYRGSAVAMVVFALDQRESLSDAVTWVRELEDQTEDNPALFLIGNKCDLTDERVVSRQEAEDRAKELGAEYYEVSAKTNNGISDMFDHIGEEALKKIGQPVVPKVEKLSINQPRKRGCC